MADQKTEDTKSPLPRRGARPFAGPAGAPAAARPFLRPATTQRATAAPFVPPIIPGKPSLGTTLPKAAAPVAPSAPAAPMPTSRPDTVFPAQASMTTPSVEVEAAPSRPRPVTSEMVALDAFDAFDAVWGGSEPPPPTPEHPAADSPLDVSSLGGGVDGADLWADDITAGADSTATADAQDESTLPTPSMGMPAWLADDVAPAVTSTAPIEAEPAPPAVVQSVQVATAAVTEPLSDPAETVSAMPEMASSSLEPASDHEDVGALPWAPAEADASYSLEEWTDMSVLPAAEEIGEGHDNLAGAAESLGAVETPAPSPAGEAETTPERPRFELVDEGPRRDIAPAHDPRTTHAIRVAAAFDRLAERVRGGDIDVSFIAPDAPDAAVLASVLAALLGGAGSSSR